MNFKKSAIKNTVLMCLETSEMCRGSDFYLAMNVYRCLGLPTDIGELSKISEAPSFETITRWRRRLQACYPDLRPDEWLMAHREEKKAEFQDIAADVPLRVAHEK